MDFWSQWFAREDRYDYLFKTYVYETTVTPEVPDVTTQAVTGITATTGTGNGNVTSDGASAITERGIVWATTANPTMANNKVTVSGTTGFFSASLTGLTPGTQYHVRAYATNAIGTSYGSDVAFLTLPAAYTVTYNGNGNTDGSPPTDSNAYYQGDTVTVLGNTGNLVKTGYTFSGWNTQADGLGTTFTEGQTFPMGTADVTLYAKWIQNTYTVTYNGNGNTGGSVPIDNNTYRTGDTVTVRGNTGSLEKIGCTFAGWNTAANGSGASYNGDDTFAMGTSNVTLYAQWTITTHNLIITDDATSITTSGATLNATLYNYQYQNLMRIDFEYGTTSYNNVSNWISVTGNGTYSRPITGLLPGTTYKFRARLNYIDSAGNPTYFYGAEKTFTTGGTAPTYTVTYNGNGNTEGTVPKDSNTYLTGATVTVLGNTGNLVKTGYSFDGWNTAANGSGTSYAGGDTFEMGSSNVTLYAQWMVNQYTITFNSNGGSTVDSITQDYGTPVTAPADPTRSGYTFTGWSLAVPATMPAENTTCTAQWTVNQYTITFNSNGGSEVDPITQDYGTPVTAPADPTKTGYTFAGWYSDKALTTAYTFSTMPAENITLYAKWTEEPAVTITYEARTGGSVNPTSETLAPATGEAQGSTATADGGFVFVNWTDEGNEVVSTDALYVPAKVGGLNVAATYYANFGKVGPTKGPGKPGTTPKPPTYTVSGTVTSGDSGLYGATVTIEGTKKSATTGSDGIYSIDGVEAGSYSITASKAGYSSDTKTVTIEGNTSGVDFDLEALTEGTMYVKDISFEVKSYGRNGSNTDLIIMVRVVNSSGQPVGGARVNMNLVRTQDGTWTFAADTTADGIVSFTLKKASKGDYTATVTSVAHNDYVWDDTKGTKSKSINIQ